MLAGKKILVGVSGSIAAYKSAHLVRLLIKAGAEVKVIMTESSKTFISPLTLSTLSKNQVLHNLADNDSWANHVMLGRWADAFIIAPLSCNTLAKLAHGLCDNLLTAVYLSATCPVIVAPAMDEDMWLHPSVQINLATIKSYNNLVIPVDNGELASGLFGEGRMAEPENIIAFLGTFFGKDAIRELAGKKVLITAGPTYEKIDPVRFIGNYSTGKMGIELAKECQRRGGEVTLIIGPTSQTLPVGMTIHKVQTADEMYDIAISHFAYQDIAVLSAAVADYKSVEVADKKIKKTADNLTVELTQTRDILKALGKLKRNGQLLVGFALETTDERGNAIKKLHEKNADLIVLNSLNDRGAGFGFDTNKINIFDAEENEYNFELKSKKEAAADIVDTLIKYMHA